VTEEWLTPKDAGRLLGIDPSSVSTRARDGRLAGSEQHDGRWRVRRSEVDRVLAEREEAVERRVESWQPLTERDRPARPKRPRCKALTDEDARCTLPSAGTFEVAGRTAGLCARHARQAEEWNIPLAPGDGADPPARPSSGKPWTAEDDAYLLAHQDAPMRVVAAHLGRTAGAVRHRRAELRREGRG
jgi:hypothetical protein